MRMTDGRFGCPAALMPVLGGCSGGSGSGDGGES